MLLPDAEVGRKVVQVFVVKVPWLVSRLRPLCMAAQQDVLEASARGIDEALQYELEVGTWASTKVNAWRQSCELSYSSGIFFASGLCFGQ